MADDPLFLLATGETLSRETMRDREAINRFAAFHLLGWKSYTGDMDLFLAKALSSLNAGGSQGIERITQDFRDSMKHNAELFGRHAFRKSLVERREDAYRSVINISMFDTFGFCLARMSDKTIHDASESIVDRIINLIKNECFANAITYSTNSTVQVQTRYSMMIEALGTWMSP